MQTSITVMTRTGFNCLRYKQYIELKNCRLFFIFFNEEGLVLRVSSQGKVGVFSGLCIAVEISIL